MTQRDQAPLLPMAIKGLDLVLRNPTNPFMTATVWEYLFEGYPVNCEVDDFEAEAVCSALEDAFGETGVINDTHLGFSFLKAVCFIKLLNGYYSFINTFSHIGQWHKRRKI